MSEKKSSYTSLIKVFKLYWVSYGGYDALVKSPYLHVALVFGLFLFLGADKDDGIAKQALQVFPNLLGFTLGGYALLVGFGDRGFHRMLSETSVGKGVSIMQSVSATFVHFLLLQSAALMIAIFQVFIWNPRFIMLFGSILFIYALISIVALVMAVFRYSNWYSDYLKHIEGD